MKTISIGDDIHAHIYSKSNYPKESADSILRRLLGISSVSDEAVKKEGETNGNATNN